VSLQSTLRYLDPFRDRGSSHRISIGEKDTLRTINQQVAAKRSLNDVADFLFESARSIIPCDRIGLAFVDESGHRVVAQYARATYEPLLLTKGYIGDLRGSSLERVIRTARPRIIDDLQEYLQEHPGSHSAHLLTREGVRSSLTCPLIVEGRVLGFMFQSSRHPHTYTDHHVELQMAISERLSQAVDKAWRIEQLMAANNAYLEMLAFVSHEIKNPVASMVTDGRLLTGGYLGPLETRQIEKIERLIGKGEYLLQLVQDYLDLARVDRGALELNARKEVDVVAEIVGPAIDVVRNQLDQRTMRLEVNLPSDEVLAECDPSLIRVVLVNLLSNAAKYGDEGGEIRLNVIREPERLEMSVWNQGQGFASEDRDRLFQRFSRLHPSAHPNIKGTGVGLYSSWRIIQLHRGRIRARSEPGAWAEFSFELSQPLDLPGASAGAAAREPKGGRAE
jgi:signal transduction histidine kinase